MRADLQQVRAQLHDVRAELQLLKTKHEALRLELQALRRQVDPVAAVAEHHIPSADSISLRLPLVRAAFRQSPQASDADVLAEDLMNDDSPDEAIVTQLQLDSRVVRPDVA
jgi:hypothetical protein